jgi:hypothetical protein
MADYGLAAQIGRGNAMPGAQQQDPQNRMMQMMQLQQLQQNMMLARDQEARQRELFGPQLEGKRLENITEGLRQRVLGNQGRETEVKANAAEMDQNARRGVVQYLTANSANPRDPKALATLAGTNPLAHDELIRRFGETDAIRARAEKEGVLSLQARNELAQSAVNNLSWTVDAVQNANEFQTLRRSLVVLDPTAADYIPEKFDGRDGEAMRRLRLRLGSWKDTAIEEDAGGRKYLLNKRTGGRRYLPEPEKAGAQTPPPAVASPFGSTMLTEPALGANADAATFNAARAMGAAVPSYTPPNAAEVYLPNSPPIIDQSARVPAATTAPPNLGPTAAAEFEKTLARETAQAGVKRQGEDVKKQEGRQSVQDTLSGMIDAYKNLGSLGELQRKDMSLPERLRIAAQARLPGDIATAVNFDAGSELTTINNLRQSLIPVLTEVMGSKAVDAARESEAILASLTSGGQSPASIARTLTNFSKKYGLGVTFKPEDLAYTPPAGAAAGARGRAAPSAAAQPATPAPAAGKPTLQEFLAKARPANPNASDADLRTYYDRTYGGR